MENINKLQFRSRQNIMMTLMRTSICIAFGAAIGYAYSEITIMGTCKACVAKEHRVTSSVANEYIARFFSNRVLLAGDLAVDTLFVPIAEFSSLLSDQSEGFRYNFAVKNGRLRVVFNQLQCNTQERDYFDVKSGYYLVAGTDMAATTLVDSATCSVYVNAYRSHVAYKGDNMKGGYFCKRYFNEAIAAMPNCIGFKIYMAATNNVPATKTIVMRPMSQTDTPASVHLRKGLEMSNPCPDYCGSSNIW